MGIDIKVEEAIGDGAKALARYQDCISKRDFEGAGREKVLFFGSLEPVLRPYRENFLVIDYMYLVFSSSKLHKYIEENNERQK